MITKLENIAKDWLSTYCVGKDQSCARITNVIKYDDSENIISFIAGDKRFDIDCNASLTNCDVNISPLFKSFTDAAKSDNVKNPFELPTWAKAVQYAGVVAWFVNPPTGIPTILSLPFTTCADSEWDESTYLSNNGQNFQIPPKKKICSEHQPVWQQEPGEKKFDLIFSIDNFYSSATLYYSEDISQSELYFVISSLNEAAEKVAVYSKKYLGLEPKFDDIEVFYRPSCIPNPDDMVGQISGIAHMKQVIISPHYCDYMEDEGVEPVSTSHIVSMIFHELIHTYLSPRLGEDTARIIEEGLTTRSQLWLAGTYDSSVGHEVAQTFPDAPAIPLDIIEDVGKGEKFSFSDNKGSKHILSVENAYAYGTIDVLVNGAIYTLWNNYCDKGSDDDGLFICPVHDGAKTNLIIFDSDDSIRKSMVDMKTDITSDTMYFGMHHLIWGQKNDEGDTAVFKTYPTNWHTLEYSFDQKADGTVSWTSYVGSELLISAFEQLHWDAYPNADPNFVLKAYGNTHKAFAEDAYSEGYDSLANNVYNRLCDEFLIDKDTCLGVFEAAGLDIDFHYDPNSIFMCLPGMGEY